MAAQAASTNNRRVSRSSTSTTTTSLTPSTKAYSTPSSQAIYSSSSSSAVPPTLVDAFASLAVEGLHPQQQEAVVQFDELRSKNASRSAEAPFAIVTQLAEPRPQAFARSTRPNRGDDDKRQQGYFESRANVHPDLVDRLVEVPATPANQKRGRSDYDEETPLDECLANLYLDPLTPLPPPATLTSASTSTPTGAPVSTTTKKTTSTSTSHNRFAKTSSRDITPSADKPVNAEADGELHQEIPLPHLIHDRILRDTYDTTSRLSSDLSVALKTHQRLMDDYCDLMDLWRITFSLWLNKNPGPMGRFTGKASKRSKSQVERDDARLDIALHNLRSARQYCKLVNAAYACESRQRHDAHKLYLQSTDSAMIKLKQKYEYDKARNKAQQKYDQARNEIRPEYDQARIELQQKHSQATIELQKKYNQARSELQQKQDQARIELQRKYEQASEQRKKSIRDSWSKAKQQHQQLSRSHRQTSSQYKQGLQELVDMTSYPSLLMVLSRVSPTQSLLPDSVGGRSQERRKRVKHDNIKQEPADEKMSDVATTSTSFSTTTTRPQLLQLFRPPPATLYLM
ncbi:hypothetical protein K457DRAFT_130085 [Linnemannia elongata AG-77]|uniref:Uncharacterized protein n=1 Tax=Linnemannia elongata AG-77 TaxID=1314771 RepID=A0A197JI60_9FUNG|nr:hypothetical protein K457DRAFT_130085 [Linnemannia elongata AG-77]